MTLAAIVFSSFPPFFFLHRQPTDGVTELFFLPVLLPFSLPPTKRVDDERRYLTLFFSLLRTERIRSHPPFPSVSTPLSFSSASRRAGGEGKSTPLLSFFLLRAQHSSFSSLHPPLTQPLGRKCISPLIYFFLFFPSSWGRKGWKNIFFSLPPDAVSLIPFFRDVEE